MSQQINLLSAVLRRKAFSFTSAAAIAAAVGIVAALTAALGIYEESRLGGVEVQARAVAKSLADARAKLDGPATETRKPDPGLEARVIDLAAELRSRQDVLDALKGGRVGTTAGFSGYLRAFSRQRVEGVWLIGFDIASGGVDLAISGRTLSADLVPAYLQRLNREPPMQGRQFASVVINQPGARASVKANPEPREESRAALPPYLEFTISSGDLGAAAAAQKADALPPGSKIMPPSAALRPPLESVTRNTLPQAQQ